MFLFIDFLSLSRGVALFSGVNCLLKEAKRSRQLVNKHDNLAHKLNIVVDLGLNFSNLEA